MRTRIRVANYEMEFAGSPRIWNELLRPIFGGPRAEERPAPAAPPTLTEPAPGPPTPAPPQAARGVQRSAAAAFAELAELGGRRAEKDAVLLAVGELGGSQRDIGFDEVARSVHAHDAFRDVRVKPHLLKHINRTRMLDAGDERETVRLTEKGGRYVAALLNG